MPRAQPLHWSNPTARPHWRPTPLRAYCCCGDDAPPIRRGFTAGQDRRRSARYAVCSAATDVALALQPGSELGALLDRPLRVEFCRQRGAADSVRVNPVAPQSLFEVADGLLAGADHHVVDFEHTPAFSVCAEADV